MITSLDPLIHAPARLAIMAMLAASDWMEFRLLREETGLSDSALSKQLTTLESAGYIQVRKWFLGKRPRTSVKLTQRGRAAFDTHVAALRALVDRDGVASSR
ncbi:MAG TPA: transcriptional regulator [Candidatus Dormibacteraeota bacterium]